MKKPVRRAAPSNNTRVVIKNPFLIAKLEKAARDMGCSLSEAVIFFVREGFDKPARTSKRCMAAVQRKETNG